MLRTYFDTRNGLIGEDYSTKFSPWLACGSLSPRYVALECRRYEEARVANKSTYWCVFELLVRDYFRYFAARHGRRIFYLHGTAGRLEGGAERKWNRNPELIAAWREGRTGHPLIDASMRELGNTGYLSNRGRQNVCSYLSIDMSVDWRVGAEFFESRLLDFDVCSNYVNWINGAGLTGGRLNRFNITKQSRDWDEKGEYLRLWVPEIRNIPNEFIHSPWEMSETAMEECGVIIGSDYPFPIISPTANCEFKRTSRKQRDTSKTKQDNCDTSRRMKSLAVGTFCFKS